MDGWMDGRTDEGRESMRERERLSSVSLECSGV